MIQATLGFATDLGERSGAWDEVYYSDQNTVADGRGAWFETTGLLGLARTSAIGRRLQCLSSQCYIYYCRLAVVGTRGASQTWNRRIDGYRSSENYAGDACVFRAFSASRQVHREIRIGGLPDNVVDGNAIDPAFFKAYIANKPLGGLDVSTFFGKLASIGGQIRFRTTPIGGNQSYAIVGSSKEDQYGNITLNLGNSGVFTLPMQVDISVRGQPQLRGRWKVASSPTTSSVILSGSQRISCPPVFDGWMTKVINDGEPLAEFGDPYLSAHKLGKKKFQRRGRQSAKLIRH